MFARSFAVVALLMPAVAAAQAPAPPPPPAAAPTDTDRAGDALKAFVDAIAREDSKALRDLLAPTVAVEGLVFTTRNCQRTFGIRRIKATKRDALAKCLVSLDAPPETTIPMVAGSGTLFKARIAVECVNYDFEVRGRKGVMQVSSITAITICDGEEGGVVGGVVGGVESGVEGGGFMDGRLTPPPPPPPPAPPQNIPPNLLEGYRTAGNKFIVPDDATKVAMIDAGKAKVIASFKVCIDETGTLITPKVLKSSGFPDYDAKLLREMRLWKYRPYLVKGKAVPVCTAVTFIYSQE